MDDLEVSGIDALAGGTPASVGHYRYDGESWFWADALYTMHGFEPGEVVPSAELMVAHLDPLDVAQARETVKQALVSAQPYASYHHLVDAKQRRHTVLVAGRGELDRHGRLVELSGYMVDLTDAVATDQKAQIDAAIAGVTEHRSAIEQAKGILMLSLGLDQDEAFALLRARSQHANLKLHALAARLVAAVVEDDVSLDESEARIRGRVLGILNE